MILLNWLFQDDDVFQSLATNFASILLRKDDHYISLGWCILARDLVEDEITKEQLQTSGKLILLVVFHYVYLSLAFIYLLFAITVIIWELGLTPIRL